MNIDLNRFRATFFQEAAEHLDNMEAALLTLDGGQSGADTLNVIFRSAHSMKAGAGTFGFTHMGQFTHLLETLLDRLRNGETEVTPALVKRLLLSVDALRAMLNSAMDGRDEAPAGLAELAASLTQSDAAAPAAAVAAPAPTTGEVVYDIGFEPNPELFQLGLDPLLVLRDLADLGAVSHVEADLAHLPRLADFDATRCYLAWRLQLATQAAVSEIRDAFAFVEDVAKVTIEVKNAEPVKEAAKAAAVVAPVAGPPSTMRETSIRVATEKVDQLIDMVGELVIAQSMAAQIMHGFTADRLISLEAAMAEVERHTRELQERVMRIRMLPIGSIFSRFPRLVRDTAETLSKQVSLIISGEETELDKGVVERLADPLTHLVRNAVDHGIESPERRLAAGKPAEAALRLSACHQGGNVVVEVSDDGAGLNTDRIRAKALERGLIGTDDPLSDDEIHALIFKPGFSTADKVSGLSGRGVGMDVVKSSVEAMNGAVAVETARGLGTTFRIKLPLTLAILDGLLLRLGEQVFVLPLASIVESIRPRREQLRNMAGRGEVVLVRGVALPLLRLSRLLQTDAGVDDPTRGLLVIVDHAGRQLALLVDELLGQQQVVVKSLETNYRRVDGITGATILGDGHAALILDVAGIADIARRSGQALAA